MANVHRTLGDENIWVEFKPNGYAYKLQRLIREERDDVRLLEIITPFVVACHLPKVDGDFTEIVIDVSNLDEVEDNVVIGLIREFFAFRQERLFSPVPPNS